MIGRSEKIEEFGNWLRDSPFNAVIIIAGNHDILIQKKPQEARKILSKHDKIHYIEDSGCRIDGISFYGLHGSQSSVMDGHLPLLRRKN